MAGRMNLMAAGAVLASALTGSTLFAQNYSKGVVKLKSEEEAPTLPKGSTYPELPSVADITAPLPTGGGSGSPIFVPGPSNLLPFEEKTLSGGGDAYLKFKAGDEHLLNMVTADGLFKFYVGGRLQLDGTWLSANDAVQAPRSEGGLGNIRDAVNPRRARFDFGGTLYKNIDFLMEFDFVNTFNADPTQPNVVAANTPAPTDLWVTFKDIPFLGNIRVGNQKPPISFEHMTSSRFLNFMERSMAFDAFVENQNNCFEQGISFFNQFLDKRVYASAGVFKNTRNVFGWDTGDGEYDVTGRVAALPVWENDGETLVHVGVGASHRDLDDHQENLRARLMVRNGPAVLHTIIAQAQMFGASRDLVVPEFVFVHGPLTLQSEYYGTWVKDATIPVTGNGPRTSVGTGFFQGGYAEALYFLTGEHKTYDRGRFAFTRVTPRSNFRGFNLGQNGEGCDSCKDGDTGSGWGAWEVGVRYSWIDMDNRGIKGGMAQDLTVGLNWYLNPYMKVQWNYTCLYRNAPNPTHDGYVQGFGTRLAFDF